MRRARDPGLALLLVMVSASVVPVTASAQPAAYVATQPSKAEEPPPDDRLDPPPMPPLRRGWAVGVDTSLGAFSGSPFLFAVDARFGRRMNLGSYFVVPEAVAGYLSFIGGGDGLEMQMGRVGGGVRIGLGDLRVLETSFFSHAGAVVVDKGLYPYTDLGAALDVRAGHHFSAGAHVAWDVSALAGGGSVYVGSLFLFGAHAGLVL